MQRLYDDLSILTCIEPRDFDKVMKMSTAIISHYVEENIRERETNTVVDIGIGTLSIANIEGKVHYKFIPSLELEEELLKTYNTSKSRLKMNIEKALGSRLLNTYKDLF